jgi:adenylate cyclase
MATVLVIDDDQVVRAMIGGAVEEVGHQATYAHDGAEAVEMVRSHPYDLVFMDLAMPHKNGLVAIQEIIADFPSIPIVAISGVDPEMLDRALDYGAMRAVMKPLTPKQVQDLVDEVLRGRPTGGWDNVRD